MEIIGWHGGWGNFTNIDEQYLGTGEGDSQGRGFYMAEHRTGGEYYGVFNRKKTGKGFLHKTLFTLDEQSYWEKAPDKPRTLSNGDIFTYSDYIQMRLKSGDEKALLFLLNNGIKAFSLWEENQPSHGYTFIAVDFNIVSILESHQYIGDSHYSYWEPLRK